MFTTFFLERPVSSPINVEHSLEISPLWLYELTNLSQWLLATVPPALYSTCKWSSWVKLQSVSHQKAIFFFCSVCIKIIYAVSGFVTPSYFLFSSDCVLSFTSPSFSLFLREIVICLIVTWKCFLIKKLSPYPSYQLQNPNCGCTIIYTDISKMSRERN